MHRKNSDQAQREFSPLLLRGSGHQSAAPPTLLTPSVPAPTILSRSPTSAPLTTIPQQNAEELPLKRPNPVKLHPSDPIISQQAITQPASQAAPNSSQAPKYGRIPADHYQIVPPPGVDLSLVEATVISPSLNQFSPRSASNVSNESDSRWSLTPSNYRSSQILELGKAVPLDINSPDLPREIQIRKARDSILSMNSMLSDLAVQRSKVQSHSRNNSQALSIVSAPSPPFPPVPDDPHMSQSQSFQPSPAIPDRVSLGDPAGSERVSGQETSPVSLKQRNRNKKLPKLPLQIPVRNDSPEISALDPLDQREPISRNQTPPLRNPPAFAAPVSPLRFPGPIRQHALESVSPSSGSDRFSRTTDMFATAEEELSGHEDYETRPNYETRPDYGNETLYQDTIAPPELGPTEHGPNVGVKRDPESKRDPNISLSSLKASVPSFAALATPRAVNENSTERDISVNAAEHADLPQRGDRSDAHIKPTVSPGSSEEDLTHRHRRGESQHLERLRKLLSEEHNLSFNSVDSHTYSDAQTSFVEQGQPQFAGPSKLRADDEILPDMERHGSVSNRGSIEPTPPRMIDHEVLTFEQGDRHNRKALGEPFLQDSPQTRQPLSVVNASPRRDDDEDRHRSEHQNANSRHNSKGRRSRPSGHYRDRDDTHGGRTHVHSHSYTQGEALEDKVPRRSRHAKHVSEPADVAGEAKSSRRRNFTKKSLQNMMEQNPSAYDIDDIGLPTPERVLLEKFIDSLSKLSIEVQMDESKRKEGRRRLNNALRALEGWI